MNAPFHPDTVGLDQLKVGTKARVASIAWDSLDEGEGCASSVSASMKVTVEPCTSARSAATRSRSRRPNDGGDPAQACR